MRGLAAALILTAGLAGASAAQAQDAPVARPAADVPAASAPLAQPGGDTTADQIAQWVRSGSPEVDPNGPPDGAGLPRQIHGEVGVTVSNRGYGGYAAASVPIGEASDVDVAVGGAHERLPWGGAVNSRSLAIGVHLDGGDVHRWLTGEKCIQHAVRLRDDPVMMADGRCVKPSDDAPPPPERGS